MDKAIEIRNLSYSYPDGNAVFEGINLKINEGERVGIIGPNGSGKTTLLLHLNGILRGKDEVKIFGLELNNGNLHEIRKRVGLVFQDPDDQLFSPTVFDDVAFGPLNMELSKDEVNNRVKEALEEVGMSGFEKRFSHALSAGEKKRIAIATVLSMNPDILAIDEPTSNLDPGMRKNLIALLGGFQTTLIIASHDLNMVEQLCTRVILLNRGRIIAEGIASEMLENKKLMQENGL
ncbi:cobalt ABC transporter ATP-binding protein [Candidatus Desantisbacteria bacterium CG_4_10_14_0_8_um_filter_39_17]|uniref:Cobalt ABC transporter ATP-binding protein n=1 Tax=Candidatus Desantisbacteria bacterium CG_4_10_14_0_8_um_filter_39_17 TaxID=1974542 RepID=A0A2H9PBX2_9BACT|nr:MAG: cobalt ABC transporter ATP-binding protein [Candidatus Desantisbacteria bacterium CG_4_10_14_0_8_um_filter_39_17]